MHAMWPPSSLILCTIHIDHGLYISTGLPLSYDLEGPSPGSDAVFVLGARAVTNGFDLHFTGSVSSAIIAPNTAPPAFSRCILDCLESITLNTIGTPLRATPFNVSARQLEILGPASPSEVQQVLRSIEYLNRAPDPNINSIELEVSTSTPYAACCVLSMCPP